LEPAFEGSFFQTIPWLAADEKHRAGSVAGRNVGAILPGTDPVLKDEWVVISAHFDHLGMVGDTLYGGADDNASGVALLMELAEHFALRKEKPRRTLLFVGFDLEEVGLQGSTHFATHPPRDVKKLKAFLTADMVGRSMANVLDEYVFVLGSETAPQLRRLVEKVPTGDGLKAGRLGADIIGTRSDYGPFRDRKVPFLFFSTGQHPDYHRPSDTPDKVDYEKARRITAWVCRLTADLADTDEPPVWTESQGTGDLEEVRTMHAIVERVLESPKKYPLTEQQRAMASKVRDQLAGYVKRGVITETERGWLVWTARLLLTTVF
jgi:Zn-dependent M28 family amino/carboxypeptidase